MNAPHTPALNSTQIAHLLVDSEAAESPHVGGKFSRQAALQKVGVPVPRFFCATTALYGAVYRTIAKDIDAALASIDYRDNATIQQASKAIEQHFLCAAIPPDSVDRINALFDEVFSPGQLVSVRASIVGFKLEESEDAADNPFAGMSTSFLYVPRDQVFEKLRRCWASGYSPEAIVYRHAQGMSTNGFAVAVGVQQMVFGERSFVMFTCNPQDLTHNTVIIAGHGIGEGVVQESVPVDHYFVNAQTGAIQHELSEKTEKLTIDQAAGFGLTRQPVPEELHREACLSDAQIETLTAMGRKIEGAFAMPQDIEGTFTEDGTLYILQSRPIALDFDRYKVWSSANVSESFPGCTTPLTFSFAQHFYYVINYDVFRRIGVAEPANYDKREAMSKILGYIDGRIYHSITNMTDIATLHPLFGGMKKEWERLGAELHSFYVKQADEDSGFSFKKLGQGIARTWGKAKTLTIILHNLFTLESRYGQFMHWWEGLMADRRGKNFAGQHPLSLAADYHRVWGEVSNYWGLTLVNWQLMIAFQSLVEKLTKQWGVDEDGSLISDLLCGDTQLKGVEIVLSAVRLADHVRATPNLAKVFAEHSAEDLWRLHEQGQLPNDFSTKVATHMLRYGDRGLQELKLEQPNLRDTPWELLRMVQGYARKDFTAQTLNDTELANRARGEALLAERLKGKPLKRAIVRWAVGVLRKVLHYREEGRYSRSELFGYSKNIFRAMGGYLASRQIIEAADDVFYLHVDELFGYFDGSGVTRNLAGLVAIRKAELAQFETQTPVKEFTSGDVLSGNVPQERKHAPGSFDGKHFQGIGSSAGKVRGIARVVHNPALGGDLGDDAILIARETDPGWLFLMLAARGIVVERGSMLSHTAITGRKFGIPTVVAVPQATQLIRDGQPIEIDGATGLVTLLDESDA